MSDPAKNLRDYMNVRSGEKPVLDYDRKRNKEVKDAEKLKKHLKEKK